MIPNAIRRRAVLTVLFSLATAAVIAPSAPAAIVGFGDGSSYTLNGYDQPTGEAITDANDPPTISSGTLTITTAAVGEARSAFYNAPQPVAGFTASFVYQDDIATQGPVGESDGFAFVVQTQGLTAVGGSGSGLGVTVDGSAQPPTGPAITAIAPSASEQFYLRNGTGATDFGVSGSGSFADATPTDSVDLADGDPILVTLIYDDAAETLTETLTDETTPTDTYTLLRSADITGVVGDNAYVGFTGATGGGYTVQTISDFTFNSVPEPASLSLLGLGSLRLLTRRRRTTR